MDFVFYYSIVSNAFSVLGVAGMLHQQRELVFAFFTYNLVAMIVVFHYFVDVCTDVSVKYKSHISPGVPAYEQAAAGAIMLAQPTRTVRPYVSACVNEQRACAVS
jgi:hypothetical protein